MDVGTIMIALVAILVTAFVAALLWRRASAKQEQAYAQQIDTTRELEKALHTKERDFLAERNRIELANGEHVRAARTAALEEGRQLGLAESKTAHINELASQRSALVSKLEGDRERAVAEARDKLRSEYELQTKLFTVMIRPYVSITEGKGLIHHDFQTVVGYQYQLLVNGIPAFSPHVVAEQTETMKAINPEVERLLVQTAERAADAAISLYLGGSTQFAKLAEPIFKRLPK